MSDSQSVFGYTTYSFIHDFEGLMMVSPEGRERIVEAIRQQVKVRSGDEKRWETDELPMIRKLCATLTVKWKDDGTLSLSPGDPSMESTLLSCSRGTSWYSAVDMIAAVAQALVLKT
jgi:hypothetical protein